MIRRVFLACALALFSSCSLLGVGAAVQPPNEAWVRASRATFNVISPRLEYYIQSDEELSPLLREMLLYTLWEWEYMIRQAEEDFGGPSAGLPPAEPPPAGDWTGPGDTVPKTPPVPPAPPEVVK